jgi:gluconate 2-dehydrogenase gamma chain
MKKSREDKADPGRRDALKTLVIGTGGLTTLPILGQAETLRTASVAPRPPAAANPTDQSEANWKPLFFDDHQNQTLIVLTDLIIPATDTPGAKAALVNRLLDLVYNEETPEEQKKMIEGLAWLDGRSLAIHRKPFVSLTQEEQTATLESLADPQNSNAQDQPGVRFFQRIKEFTIFGYYTSKIGLDMELQYTGDTYNSSFPGACTSGGDH